MRLFMPHREAGMRRESPTRARGGGAENEIPLNENE